MNYNIAVINGDGIGAEITPQAIKVLEVIGEKFNHSFKFNHVLMGGCAIDETGIPLPRETIDTCLNSDSVLLGAVGGPKWDNVPGHMRPEAGLLNLRAAMKLYANLRPARLFGALKNACPLRTDIAEKGIDMVFVRELTGGIYFGERGRRNTQSGVEAFDTECYSELEIERIARVAFEIATVRNKKVTSIDKANVLESSRLWREVVHKTAESFPEIEVGDMLVDNAAMQLVKNPSQFDVVLASNMFGDILSDESAMITGSIGMLASASLGDTKRNSSESKGHPLIVGLYEPIHGSAPDIAGMDKANPISAILSAAMMLKYSFGLNNESAAIETAVDKVLQNGVRTLDIKDGGTSNTVGTKQMGELICDAI